MTEIRGKRENQQLGTIAVYTSQTLSLSLWQPFDMTSNLMCLRSWKFDNCQWWKTIRNVAFCVQHDISSVLEKCNVRFFLKFVLNALPNKFTFSDRKNVANHLALQKEHNLNSRGISLLLIFDHQSLKKIELL